MFQYNEINSLSQLDDWGDDWRQLSARTVSGASVFRSYEWFRALLENCEQRFRPRALAVSLAGRPIGIAPLVEIRSEHRVTLQYVPTLWPSPMLPVGPNIAATLTALTKYQAAKRIANVFELGPVDQFAGDLGRTANAFRLAELRPLRRVGNCQHVIDLESVKDAGSRLSRQLTEHQQAWQSQANSVGFHRYRSGDTTGSLTGILRQLDAGFPNTWTEARHDRLVRLLQFMDQQAVLDVSLMRLNGKLASLLIAHCRDDGLEGGLFLSTAPFVNQILLGELVRRHHPLIHESMSSDSEFSESPSLETLLRRVGERQLPTLRRRRNVLRYVDTQMERHHKMRTAVSGALTVVVVAIAGWGVHAELAPQWQHTTLAQVTPMSNLLVPSEPHDGLRLTVGQRVMTCSAQGIGTWEHVDIVTEQRQELAIRFKRG